MDAVKELAANAGMDVPAADPRAAERAERANSLYDVMTAAADWFTEQLGSNLIETLTTQIVGHLSTKLNGLLNDLGHTLTGRRRSLWFRRRACG